MATLERVCLYPNPVRHTWVDDSELPLERIYACEQNHATELLLTQPLNGQVTTWTWAGAIREVRQIAAWLKAQDWPPGSRIVILSRNSAWWLMADFAIWMAGHVSVPLFPAASGGALTGLFRHCQPVACFLGQFDNSPDYADEAYRNMAFVAFPNCDAAHAPQGSVAWSEIVRTQPPLAGTPVRDRLDVATIIYTSGTTGQPKGAMHTFQGLTLMGKSMEPIVGGPRKQAERMLSYLPLAHIAERAIVEMNALLVPMEIYFIENQETFLTDLERARATVFFSVPRLFNRFQQKVFEKLPEKKLKRLLALPLVGALVRKKIVKRLGLHHARIIAGGGAATPVELIRWYRALGLNFVEGYGMTETGITHVPLPGQYRLGFVGNASPCAATRISPEGEVQIAGPMNMTGYFRNPELTEQAFTNDGYFRTGDRGKLDEAGRLRLLGRLKEEFKTAKGKFVVPARIEELLSSATLFESVAIFGAGMTLPFALAVLTPAKRHQCADASGRAAVEAELVALLEQVNPQLEQYERLRFLAITFEPWTTHNGFLTPTMKVRRPALEQRFSVEYKAWERQGAKVVWLENE
ncbi:MAG: AMP-binding protein [Terracidiphilus sp.]